MRQTVYIFMFVCLLAFFACGSDVPSPQAEESHILHPDFRAEGLLSMQASAAGRPALQTENGEVTEVGVCITAENSHDPYLSSGVTRYTFTTDGIGYVGTDISTTPMSPLHLNNENAILQAFHPSTATPAESGASDYTIPVNISPAQSFNTTADGQKLQCTATDDYLYGSAKNTVGDATPVTANNTHASPTIYMHHALAKVVFTLQCDENRTPSATDCVKSITLTAAGSGTPFLHGAGTMRIRDGAFAGLSSTHELSFTPTPGGSPIVAGEAGSPSTVACGLVAPLSGKPGDITLAVTLGKEGETTYDRTYTVTSAAFNVQWQKGYCYTYNMVLGSRLTVTQQAAASWTGTPAGDTPAVTPKEKGIGNPDELVDFATAWNANGLTQNADGSFDYSPYEPYGWYEKDADGKRVFTIKITNSFTISKDNLDAWVPIGNDAHPLTIPFDGQGWQIILDFTYNRQSMAASDGTYAGIIGYTRSTVSNVRILCTFSGATSEYNVLESGTAAYAGMLAGRSEGDITNCTVEMEGTTLLSQPSGGSTSYFVGGLVGYCSQNVSNCAVSQTHNIPATLQVTPSATSTIHMGALAGQVTGTVSNCYTYMGTLCKEDPESATGSTVNAGWLTGDGGSFTGCHYYEGTATGCEAADYSLVAGTTSITDLNGLCTALNAGVDTHPLWSHWAEKQNGTDVTAVFLFEYRNKQ